MFYEYSNAKYKILCLFRKQLIPTIEYYLQTKDRIKYIFNKILFRTNIISIDGCCDLNNRILIFATYPGKTFLETHVDLIKKFENRGYSIVIVTNNKKATELLKKIEVKNKTIITRKPFGRDFGCYKEATLHILNNHKNIDKIARVIYLNDSIITLKEGQEKIVDHLVNEHHDFSGLTENYEFDYHVGSFAIAISGDIFRSRQIIKYWRNYTPLSTRRYSIHKGEMGFTKAIKKQGHTPFVLYKLSSYKQYLFEQDYQSLWKIYNLLGFHFHKKFNNFLESVDDELEKILGTTSQIKKQNQKSILKGLVSGADNGKFNEDPDLQLDANIESYDAKRLAKIRYRNRILNLSEADQSAIANKSLHEKLIDTILNYIFLGSQIHNACAVLLYMKTGLIKKDIVYRCLIEPHKIEFLINDAGYKLEKHELDCIISEIIGKGHPYSFQRNPYKRIMYEWGFV